MNNYKKFISPYELMKKFNIDEGEYREMCYSGLPRYECAGVTRHAIDEIYLWCEENRKPIIDYSNICSKSKLCDIFNVGGTVISKWEELGMPKHIVTDKLNSNKRTFKYDIDEVKNWLKKSLEV